MAPPHPSFAPPLTDDRSTCARKKRGSAATMLSNGYESVNKEETPSPATDRATVPLATVVAVLSCSVSLLAITFIVWSVPF